MQVFLQKHRAVADIIFAAIILILMVDIGNDTKIWVSARNTVRQDYAGVEWTKELRAGEAFKITRLVSHEPAGCIVFISRWFMPIGDPTLRTYLEPSFRPSITTVKKVEVSQTIPKGTPRGDYFYQGHADYDCHTILDKIFGRASFDTPPLAFTITE